MSNQRTNEETGAHSDGGRACQGLRETFPTLDTIDRTIGSSFSTGSRPCKYSRQRSMARLVNSANTAEQKFQTLSVHRLAPNVRANHVATDSFSVSTICSRQWRINI